MRKLLALLTCLFILSPNVVLSETVKFEDLVITSGFYYKRFTDVPFTGKITGKEQGKIKNGKKEGRWKIYNRDGRVDKEITFRNGKKTGFEVRYKYYSNGQLEYKGDYKNGKWDGPWVHYHQNGQLYEEGNYKNGKKISD